MWKTKFGKCIFTSPSGYKVYQNFFYRWLTLGSNALQTMINRCAPEKPVLHYLPALTLTARHYPEDSCLLGLGGAGVAHLLAAKQPHLSLTAIDSSQEVIDIAKQFFMVERIAGLTIAFYNAANYVEECSLSYLSLIHI